MASPNGLTAGLPVETDLIDLQATPQPNPPPVDI